MKSQSQNLSTPLATNQNTETMRALELFALVEKNSDLSDTIE